METNNKNLQWACDLQENAALFAMASLIVRLALLDGYACDHENTIIFDNRAAENARRARRVMKMEEN